MLYRNILGCGAWLLLCSLQASELVHNSAMELGQIGKGVPGYQLKMYSIDRDEMLKNQSRKHIAVTVANGKEGNCLMIPAYSGAKLMMLEPGDIKIEQDGEVEISFDAKIGESTDGKSPDTYFYIDFRTLGDDTVKLEKSWSHPNYPIISGLSGKPGKDWQTFSRRIKVIKWNNVYTTSLRVLSSRKDGNVNAPLYIDNFRIRFLDGKDEIPEEAAIVPDQTEGVYFHGDKMTFTIHALLRGDEGKNELILQETSYPERRMAFPVELKKDSAFNSQNGLARYSGTVSIEANRYGLFRCFLSHDGKILKSIGLVSVLHPPVAHKRFSPGWSIGMNSAAMVPHATPYSKQQQTATLHSYNSFEQTAAFPKLAGIRNARIWGKWSLIEPEKGNFSSKIIGPEINVYNRNGIEPYFCIAGGMGMMFHDDGPDSENMQYPRFLYPKLTKFPKKHQGKDVLSLSENSLDDYKQYLDYCLKTWKDQVHIWEQFNEPGVLDMDPNLYLKYMKYSYQAVKAINKNFIFLGNGNTCDIGYDKGWCFRLSAADPDYTDYLDGIAFHPYYNATDYQDNVYNLYSKHIAELRSSMKKQKPLYNTECFYIKNARVAQVEFYVQKGRFSAEAVQRHFLDGMLNGVKMASSPDNNAVVNHEPTGTGLRTLSEAGVALNALSAQLKNMATLEPIILNPFMRAGIFTDESKQDALGFIYDLRASGSFVVGVEKCDVKLLDLFGNPIKKEQNVELSYEPMFVRGSLAQLKAFFQNVRFVPKKSCRIFGRQIKNRIYLTAVNLTGQPGIMEIDFGKVHNLPSVCFEFLKDRDDSTVDFPVAENADYRNLPFSIHTMGAELGGGKIEMLPDTKVYEIPTQAKQVAEFELSRGSTIRIWSEEEQLRVTAKIKTERIHQAAGDELWTGDAVEIFVDPAPFSKPNHNQIISTNPLDCYQYVFAGIPSKNGKSVLGISRKNQNFHTQATVKTTLTENGYWLDIRIPWDEIRPQYNGMIGLEVEIARPGETGWKESLSDAKKPAFAQRRHYPLFQAKFPHVVSNGDFADTAYGDAAQWMFGAQTKESRNRCVPKTGIDGRNAVEFRCSKLNSDHWGQFIFQQLEVPAWVRGAWVSVLAEMPECSLPNAQFYRWRPHGFFITLGKSDMSYDRNMEFSKPFPWTLFQYYTPIQKGTDKLDFYSGLRQALGLLRIAEVRVEFVQ